MMGVNPTRTLSGSNLSGIHASIFAGGDYTAVPLYTEPRDPRSEMKQWGQNFQRTLDAGVKPAATTTVASTATATRGLQAKGLYV